MEMRCFYCHAACVFPLRLLPRQGRTAYLRCTAKEYRGSYPRVTARKTKAPPISNEEMITRDGDGDAIYFYERGDMLDDFTSSHVEEKFCVSAPSRALFPARAGRHLQLTRLADVVTQDTKCSRPVSGLRWHHDRLYLFHAAYFSSRKRVSFYFSRMHLVNRHNVFIS